MASPGGSESAGERMERRLGALLQAAVATAAALVLVGGVLYLLKYGGSVPRYTRFRGEPADLSSIAGVVRSAADLRGRSLIQLGLLLLIATPVARVGFSLLSFIRQGDRVYIALTTLVLLLLLAGMSGLLA